MEKLQSSLGFDRYAGSISQHGPAGLFDSDLVFCFVLFLLLGTPRLPEKHWCGTALLFLAVW